MSIEDANAFLKRLKTDEELSRKATECQSKADLLSLATEAEFVFTKDDIKAAGEDLTEEDLQGVSGGGSTDSSARCKRCRINPAHINGMCWLCFYGGIF